MPGRIQPELPVAPRLQPVGAGPKYWEQGRIILPKTPGIRYYTYYIILRYYTTSSILWRGGSTEWDVGGVRRSTRRENDMMTQAATPEGMTTEETAVAGRVLPTVAAIAVWQELDA